jgi:tetratricopeptide (TPR) repeat protein
MYICRMKYLLPTLCCIFLIIACKDKNGRKDGDGTKDLPAYVKSLQERVKQYPDSTGIRFQLIEAYDSLGMYTEGLAQTDSLIKRDSTNNAVWMKKGMLQEKAKDTAGAIISYTRSINIYPAVDAQLYLANLFAERRNDTALLLVNSVSNMMFDNRTLAECDFIAGVYHARKGNAKMAEQLFTRCIAQDHKFMEAYMEKGLLYFDQKKYDEAIKIFQAASSVDPTYADAFYYQAKCLQAQGKTQEAINMYQQSLRIDPNLKEASEALTKLGVQVS